LKSSHGKSAMEVLSDSEDEFPRIVFPSRRWRKWSTVFPDGLDPLIDDIRELLKYFSLIAAMYTAKHKTWAAANVALIFF
jgi:hypothetical protein